MTIPRNSTDEVDLTPWVASFRPRFPEFANTSDESIAYAIFDAMCWVDSSWSSNCNDCGLAILYLAAHFLALQKFAADVITAGDDTVPGGVVLPGGQVTRIGFETMSVGFSSPRFAASSRSRSSTKEPYDLSSTPYGQRYLALLRANVPAVLVV